MLLRSNLISCLFLSIALSSVASAESILYEIAQINANTSVNVREADDVNSRVAGSLRPKDTFAVTKKNDWFIILDGPFNGKYVRQEFAALTGEKYPLSKIVANSVRLRGSPSKDGPVRGEVDAGETFASSKNGDWYEIKDGRHRGKFVASQFVADLDNTAPKAADTREVPLSPGTISVDSVTTTTTTLPETTTTTTTLATTTTTTLSVTPTTSTTLPVAVTAPESEPTSNTVSEILKGTVIAQTPVNVRSSPSPRGAIKGKISPGTPIDVVIESSEWYKIQSGPRAGSYISAPFVKVETVPTTSPTTTLPPMPTTTTIPLPTPSTEIPSAELPSANSSPSPAEVTNLKGTVVAQTAVNVRAEPSVKGLVKGKVSPGNVLDVTAENTDWYKIQSGPLKGAYLSAPFLKVESLPAAPPTTSQIPVAPEAPPTPSETTTETPTTTTTTFPPQAAPDPVIKGVVIAQTAVNVRALPSVKGRIKGKVSPGEFLDVIVENAEWYRIKSGAMKDSFIATPFIKILPAVNKAESPEATTTTVDSTSTTTTTMPSTTTTTTLPAGPAVLKGVVVAQTPVNVRNSPSAKSPSKGKVSPGMSLEVTAENSEWYKIQSGLNKGDFISAPFVKIQSPSSAPETSGNKASTNTQSMTSPDWDPKKEKLFQEQVERAFKKKTKAVQENDVVMPVYFEDRTVLLGQIDSRVKDGEDPLVDALGLFKFLHLLVTEPWFSRPDVLAFSPESAKDSQEQVARRWITIGKFENTGIKVILDIKKLDIIISVPADMRAPTVASLLKGRQGADEISAAEPPAGFSSYLNINMSETFDTRYDTYKDKRLPLVAQLENGTHVAGVTLEANGRYLEDRSGGQNENAGFSRGDVRLVKDFPSKTIRTSVGDLVYPTTGFQTFRQMGGFSVTSQFSMARSKLTYPTGNYELFLQRNSKVYIWINDQLQQVLELPAGRHSLRDFPFTGGANELRFEIVDDVGREETLKYSYFSSTELLRPELHQYNFAVGAPSTDLGKSKVYDSNNTTYSLFHRYGWKEDMTVGANFQGDKQQTIIGLETLFSSSLGFFKVEPAYSMVSGGGTGAAIQGRYTYTDYQGKLRTQRSYNLGVYHAGTSFTPLGSSLTAVTKKIFEISSGYSQGLSKNVSMNISGSLRFFNTLTGVDNAFTLNLGGNRRWDNGLSLSSTISHSKSTSGNEDLSIFAFLLWSFPKEKQIVTAIHNTLDQSSRLDWSYNPSTGADSSTYGGAIRDSEKERGYSAQLLHDGNRIRSSLSHEVIFDKPSKTNTTVDPNKKTSNHVTNMTLGTSLAYAGGHFAIGRPISDSFAIIAPVKNLSGQRLDVNPLGEETYTAKSDFLGSAVLSEIGSYNLTEVYVSGRKLPPGLNLPKDHFLLHPRYKSGYAFEIGTDATVSVTAKMLAPDGTPLSLAAGRAIYLDDNKHEPVTVFTNKKGVLSSEGFKAGRYRLEITPESFEPVEITIPESATESYDLGTLKLKAK